MFRSLKEIKSHYHFTDEDESRLRGVRELMLSHGERIIDDLHSWVMGLQETAAFFTEESKKERVFESHKEWFADLFSGNYDSRYYDKMIRIGQIHERAKADSHFIIRSFNIIRSSCKDVFASIH
ncbi:MAG: protoglobin domain-containing protein [Dissulfurispiraceae bacterium]